MNITKIINLVDYYKVNIGNIIKSSKCKYIWLFSIEDEDFFDVALEHSKYSGKVRVYINNIKKSEIVNLTDNFYNENYYYNDQIKINFNNTNGIFEISINGKPFNNLKSKDIQLSDKVDYNSGLNNIPKYLPNPKRNNNKSKEFNNYLKSYLSFQNNSKQYYYI